jgi:transposase
MRFVPIKSVEQQSVAMLHRSRALLMKQRTMLLQRLQTIEKKLVSWHYRNDLSNRLETIPGVGFVTASALALIVPEPEVFRSGRHFAAWGHETEFVGRKEPTRPHQQAG